LQTAGPRMKAIIQIAIGLVLFVVGFGLVASGGRSGLLLAILITAGLVAWVLGTARR